LLFCRLTLRLALLAVSVSLAAASAQAGLYSPKQYTLKNGMQVLVIEDHRAPVVSHMVWYRVGAADEPARESGVAHLLEHLMFKATGKIAAGEFSKIVARNGGRDNAFTSYDYTGYFQNVARDKLDLVMGMEADRMVNLQLTQKDLDTERQVVLEERRSRTENNPAAQMGEMMSATQFMAHPYGIPVIGWRHEVEALTLKDVRAFYRLHYAPNNAILIVAGDVTGDEVHRLAVKHFGGIPAADTPARLRPQEPPQLAARRVEFRDPRVGQPSFSRSYLAPSRVAGRTELALPLSFLADILGGGTTSRLYQELVVKQSVAAGAGAHYGGTSLDPTSFYLYATPTPGVPLEKLEAALDKVLADFLRDGVNAEELERSRTGKLAAAIYARDDMFSGPRVFGDALTAGLTVEQVESWTDEVRQVTAEDVMEAARYVLNDKRSVTGYLRPEEE
jgi:zinc protease